MVNAIKLPIKCQQLDLFDIGSLKSSKIATDNQILKFVFNENILLPSIEPVISD